MTGTGGGRVSSTPRVARYSGLTVRRRWPLGSMFLDGMGNQLSALQEKDKAGDGDHAEGYPLDWVENLCVGEGLAEEGEEKLYCACDCESQSKGIAGVLAARELAQEDEGEKCCHECCVQSYRVQWSSVGRNRNSPGKDRWEAGVAAF